MNTSDNHNSTMISWPTGHTAAGPQSFDSVASVEHKTRGGYVSMFRTGAVLLCILANGVASAGTKIHITGSFESGQFQPSGRSVDSFVVRTVPIQQNGTQCISTSSGGGDAASNWDTRVVRSEVVAGQKVTPRKGQFFARSALYYDKDYTCLNNGEPKARMGLYLGGRDENRVHFDTEAYVALSIFVPKNFENETGTKGDRGTAVLFGVNADSSASFFSLKVFVPKDGNEARWYFDYQTNPYSVREDRTFETRVDLGPVAPDKGQWTDFVIRFRSNPFSEATNPAKLGIPNAHDVKYEGNRGILQVWKAEGSADANGDRTMKRKVNVLNAPVGNVPGTTNGKSKLGTSILIYKYNWQRQPTNVKGPVWFGFDEYRLGEVVRDGTGYSEVHPAGLACTAGCPAGASDAPPSGPVPPKAPHDLRTTN